MSTIEGGLLSGIEVYSDRDDKGCQHNVVPELGRMPCGGYS